MYKPVSVTVGATATLLAPAVAPKPGDILEWEAETGFDVGDLVETEDGLLFWCVAAGETGTEAPDHDDGDAVDGSVTWRACHGRRTYLAIVNHGESAMFIGIGEAAVANKGIRLNSGGGTLEYSEADGPVPQGKIWAITASDSSVVGIQEG